MEGKTFGPSDIDVKRSTRFYDSFRPRTMYKYSTHSRNRGAVLIINNVVYANPKLQDRCLAEKDSEMLEELFLHVGCIVESHTNLTGQQMKGIITKFKMSSLLEIVDTVFVIVMGHGCENSDSAGIVGTDGKYVTTVWIEQQFSKNQCKVLKNKPKIFVYQTCCENIDTNERNRDNEKDVSDMLIVESTTQVEASRCNWKIGNFYITTLCKTIMNHAHCKDLVSLVKIANDEFVTAKPKGLNLHKLTYANLQFRTCYLHPKIYLEDRKLKSIY